MHFSSLQFVCPHSFVTSPFVLRLKKPVKIGLWLLGFAVLGLLGLWLEHERAKARLAAFKAQLIAKGEKLAIADHVPKLPPALSNAAPDFLAAAERLTKLEWEFQPKLMRLVAPGRARVMWLQTELPTEAQTDIWSIVTAQVEENRDVLAEMATALERPKMAFYLDYSKGFDLPGPPLGRMTMAVNTIANAVAVDLRADQSASAISNLLVGVRLIRLQEEPLMTAQKTRIANGHTLQQATWEVLQHPRSTGPQLRELQAAWQPLAISRGWMAAGEMERAFGLDLFAKCRTSPDMASMVNWNDHGASGPSGTPFLEDLWNRPERAADRAARFATTAVWAWWFSGDDEQWTLRQHQICLDGAREALTAGAFAPAHKRIAAASTPLDGWPKTAILSRWTTSGVDRNNLKFASFETVRRLTFTSIALHRHRLKHERFSAALDALVPEFLSEVPRDFMDGQPLRYKLQPDGQFLLWSVGEDFKDNGGDPTSVGASSYNPFDWLKGRDWVWPLPASNTEVESYHHSLRTKK
ncbi:MAG: Uncharacterized protein FD161_4673 [Limisphaerales bacterium]|nr:MAG: Uncharacterized protein FD161_4673 [Limisphaerales bacterium]KAG0506731.1 MAG: Uncharacterized protein E1N63_4114 [Limisphaerales bacterium]TXT51715.1 MAG: Uncharacterized protein FD140_1519 [Limisphaerales bacterium]